MTTFDPDSIDPVVDRAARNKRGSQLAQLAISKCPSPKFVAALLGVQVWHLYKCQDPSSKHQIDLCEIKGLAPKALRVIVEELADQIGCSLVENAKSADTECDFRSLADTAKACGDTVSAFSGALADRHIDPKEAESIIVEAKRAIECLHQIVDRAKHAFVQRGSRVREAS